MKNKLLLVFFLCASVCLMTLSSCKKELEHFDMIESTCQSEGQKEYWKDQKGRIYLDEKGKKKIKPEEIVIPRVKLEHIEHKNASDKEPGHIEHYRCPKCGKLYKDEYAHIELNEDEVFIPMSLTYIDEVEATCLTTGIKHHYIDGNGNIYLDFKGLIKGTEEDLIIPKVELIKHEQKDPTPLADGNIEYYECPKCGKCYRSNDASKENEIARKDTIIPAMVVKYQVTRVPNRSFPGYIFVTVNGVEGKYELPVVDEDHYTFKDNYIADNYYDTSGYFTFNENTLKETDLEESVAEYIGRIYREKFDVSIPAKNYSGYIIGKTDNPDRTITVEFSPRAGNIRVGDLLYFFPVETGYEATVTKVEGKRFSNYEYKEIDFGSIEYFRVKVTIKQNKDFGIYPGDFASTGKALCYGIFGSGRLRVPEGVSPLTVGQHYTYRFKGDEVKGDLVLNNSTVTTFEPNNTYDVEITFSEYVMNDFNYEIEILDGDTVIGRVQFYGVNNINPIK